MSWLQVLVACSHTPRRTALVEILAQCGLEPLIAADTSEIAAVLGGRPVHLVFCEDSLPEGGYREVLRITKAIGSGVPVVVCSPLGELDRYLEAMELGAFDFVAPPYRRAEVEAIVNAVRRDSMANHMGGTPPPIQAGTACLKNKAVA